MRTHVQRTVSWCYVVLRQLRQIHHSVPTDTFQTLVVSLVLTRLYYSISVLAVCHRGLVTSRKNVSFARYKRKSFSNLQW